MFPSGTWVFVAQGTDTVQNEQYGFRYLPQLSQQVSAVYKTRAMSSSYSNLTSNGTVFRRGDGAGSCGQTLQYTRLYC